MIDLLLSSLSFLIFTPFALGAIAEGGVLGTTRGKVGNVVFSTWKGINTVRAKVDPANPQTQAQQENRTDFGNLAKVGSDLNLPLLQPYWDWVEDKESGFNTFVKENMPGQGGNLTPVGITVTPGDMPELKGVDAVAGPGSDDVEVQWSAPNADYDHTNIVVVAIESSYDGALIDNTNAVPSDESVVIDALFESAAYYPVMYDSQDVPPRESFGEQATGALYEV